MKDRTRSEYQELVIRPKAQNVHFSHTASIPLASSNYAGMEKRERKDSSEPGPGR